MGYVKDVHFTETEFERLYRRATEKDFQVGLVYFKKVRFFAMYQGLLVILPKQLVPAAVQFHDDISSGLAYIKRDLPKVEFKMPEEKEVVGERFVEPEQKSEEVVSEDAVPHEIEKTEEKPKKKVKAKE